MTSCFKPVDKTDHPKTADLLTGITNSISFYVYGEGGLVARFKCFSASDVIGGHTPEGMRRIAALRWRVFDLARAMVTDKGSVRSCFGTLEKLNAQFHTKLFDYPLGDVLREYAVFTTKVQNAMEEMAFKPPAGLETSAEQELMFFLHAVDVVCWAMLRFDSLSAVPDSDKKRGLLWTPAWPQELSDYALQGVSTVSELLAQFVADLKNQTVMLGLFAGQGLALATFGILGWQKIKA